MNIRLPKKRTAAASFGVKCQKRMILIEASDIWQSAQTPDCNEGFFFFLLADQSVQ